MRADGLLTADGMVYFFIAGLRTDRRGVIMRLTCMFSFILLFGLAGLVVFIHLQDPVEMVHQQGLAPGQTPSFFCFLSFYDIFRAQLQPKLVNLGKGLDPLSTSQMMGNLLNRDTIIVKWGKLRTSNNAFVPGNKRTP